MPLINNLHSLVETYIPGDMRHQIHLALTDEFVHQFLLLLCLGIVVQLILYVVLKTLRPFVPAGAASGSPDAWSPQDAMGGRDEVAREDNAPTQARDREQPASRVIESDVANNARTIPPTEAWTGLRNPSSPEEFYASWLSLLCGGVRGTAVGLLLMRDEEGRSVAVAKWP